MFKQRLLTTLVLVPLVLLVIYYAPAWLLAGILLFLLAVCGFEWTKLIPMDCLAKKMAYVVVLLVTVWLSSQWLMPCLTAGMLAWLLVFIAVVMFPQSQQYWGSSIEVGVFLETMDFFIIASLCYPNFCHPNCKCLYLCFCRCIDVANTRSKCSQLGSNSDSNQRQ